MLIHQYSFRAAQGHVLPLDRWRGQPMLLVNTASQCGYTPQYQKLQSLYEEFRHNGLMVLALPCNEFGNQEPGSDEDIATFCSRQFGVTFPVSSKVSIIGKNPHRLFVDMQEEYGDEILPRWNFHKYLFGRDGGLIEHFPSSLEPDEPGFRNHIERNLGSWTI